MPNDFEFGYMKKALPYTNTVTTTENVEKFGNV